MSGLTNYVKNKVIDSIMRGVAFTPPTDLYFALILSGGGEVSGGSYARSHLVANLANFCGTQAGGSTTASSGTSGATSNNVAIEYAAPTADWGTVSDVWVYDAASGGNLLMKGKLTNSKNISNGDPAPLFPAGAFIFAITDSTP